MSDKSEMKADGQLAGTPSQIFDGVALVLSADGVQTLLKDASAIQWVADAYAHLKAIGLNPDAQPLLKKANVKTDEGITELDETFLKAASNLCLRNVSYHHHDHQSVACRRTADSMPGIAVVYESRTLAKNYTFVLICCLAGLSLCTADSIAKKSRVHQRGTCDNLD